MVLKLVFGLSQVELSKGLGYCGVDSPLLCGVLHAAPSPMMV